MSEDREGNLILEDYQIIGILTAATCALLEKHEATEHEVGVAMNDGESYVVKYVPEEKRIFVSLCGCADCELRRGAGVVRC